MFKFLTAASVILALLFSVVPAAADDHRSDYYAPTWRYDSPGHQYRRFDNYDRREYREHRRDHRDYRRDYQYDWRNSYYENSYEDFRGPLSKNRLIVELNNQGFYWVYNIRPSFRHNYVTAYAFDRRYGGRLVYLRVNQFNGHVFYFRYN